MWEQYSAVEGKTEMHFRSQVEQRFGGRAIDRSVGNKLFYIPCGLILQGVPDGSGNEKPRRRRGAGE
jgi:hypothetical protein